MMNLQTKLDVMLILIMIILVTINIINMDYSKEKNLYIALFIYALFCSLRILMDDWKHAYERKNDN